MNQQKNKILSPEIHIMLSFGRILEFMTYSLGEKTKTQGQKSVS